MTILMLQFPGWDEAMRNRCDPRLGITDCERARALCCERMRHIPSLDGLRGLAASRVGTGGRLFGGQRWPREKAPLLAKSARNGAPGEGRIPQAASL